MEALHLVWLTSIVGAGAFSTAGYVLGQRGLARVPAKNLGFAAAIATPLASPAVIESSLRLAKEGLPSLGTNNDLTSDEETRVGVVPDQIAREAAPSATYSVLKEQLDAANTELETARAEAVAATEKAQAAEAAKTKLTAALAEATDAAAKARAAEAAAKTDLSAVRVSTASSTEKVSALEAGNAELARQIEVVRGELRDEVIARATAAARAEELGDRLAKASEESASLRHKLSLLDKQAKQLRDGVQERERRLLTSESYRKRDHEETEEMRSKLRDLNEKLERASLPPNSLAPAPAPRPSTAPTSGPSATTVSLRPGSDAAAILQSEVARLATENRELRARVLGSMPPKKSSRGSMPDLDLDLYRSLIERLGSATGTRCAVVADEIGSLLVGSGDLAEGLAAFGAYIRDASARTERLLPLDGVEEIDIRDRQGTVLSTRIIVRAPSELSLVILGAEGASLADAKRVAEETLKLRQP